MLFLEEGVHFSNSHKSAAWAHGGWSGRTEAQGSRAQREEYGAEIHLLDVPVS